MSGLFGSSTAPPAQRERRTYTPSERRERANAIAEIRSNPYLHYKTVMQPPAQSVSTAQRNRAAGKAVGIFTGDPDIGTALERRLNENAASRAIAEVRSNPYLRGRVVMQRPTSEPRPMPRPASTPPSVADAPAPTGAPQPPTAPVAEAPIDTEIPASPIPTSQVPSLVQDKLTPQEIDRLNKRRRARLGDIYSRVQPADTDASLESIRRLIQPT